MADTAKRAALPRLLLVPIEGIKENTAVDALINADEYSHGELSYWNPFSGDSLHEFLLGRHGTPEAFDILVFLACDMADVALAQAACEPIEKDPRLKGLGVDILLAPAEDEDDDEDEDAEEDEDSNRFYPVTHNPWVKTH